MKYALIVLALVVLLCSASMALPTGPQSAGVTLNVAPFVYAYFPGSQENVPADAILTYGAIDANNKPGFAINIPAGATAGDDTVNIVWGCNKSATLSFSLNKGTGTTALPGAWLMEFDGAGVSATNVTFNTTDPDDIGKNMVVPVKLMVSGITMSTLAGSYSGTLSIYNVATLP